MNRNRWQGFVVLAFGLALVALGLDAHAEMEARRIVEMKGDAEPLWVFLGKVPGSFEAQVLYALVGSGFIGMIGSWLWKMSKGQADLSHFTWRYALSQLLWLIGSSVAAIMTVGFQTESGEFFGWLSVLWAGGFAGFSGDVKVKKESADGSGPGS